MRFDAEAIAKVTQGVVLHDGPAGAILTDTRRLEPGCWFLAIVGDRFDGHDFLAQAEAAGVAGVIVSRPVPEGWSVGAVQVENTTTALQGLGRAARRAFEGPVVALSGSSGKTTTRALIALALSPLGEVHQTVGNLNNHFGVPMTLLAAPSTAALQVVEMGTSSPGEIAVLAMIGEPDVRLLVNVGPAHLEELGGLEGVAREKGSLFATARPGDVVVVNLDDPFLAALPIPEGVRVVTWGRGGDIDLLDARLDPEALATDCRWSTPQGDVAARLPVPGAHIAHNAAGALACAYALGVDLGEAAAAMEGYQPVGMRLRVERLVGGAQALNDAYNANPASMEASLRLLAQLPGRRVAVMGDMLELGPDEAAWHEQVVALAHTLGLDQVVLVGPRMAAAQAACPGADAFETPEAALASLRGTLGPTDRVLFKGSRGAAVERVLTGLQEDEG